MKRKFKQNLLPGLLLGLLAPALLTSALTASAQSPAAAARLVGNVTAVGADSLTVQPEAGAPRTVEVPPTAVLKRVPAGAHDLSATEPIALAAVVIGDRALIKLDPATATEARPRALQVVVLKQEDLALRQQRERDEWQRNGCGGLVKSVDAQAGLIQLATGVGPSARIVAVHLTSATRLLRYAPDSVRYELARPAPLTAIQPGDQLRARGQKSPDGGSLEAAEIVSGSFRSVAGLVLSVDPAAGLLVVRDLTSKKPVSVHVGPETQLRRLPEAMAAALAARLKQSANPPSASAPPSSAAPSAEAHPGQRHGSMVASDPQQMLGRAPVIPLADLKKNEAVMLVATDGTAGLTAITVVAGVEPLFEAPSASQNLLSNWSVGGGAGESAP